MKYTNTFKEFCLCLVNQNFDELQELLAGYVLGDLTSEEVAKVKQLLETSPELKVEVNGLQNSLALLPWALPETSPPKNL
ncbi:hypothetical protein A2T98_21400 [Nodularia spumigena CENA596]|uniref:Zinc-finger domain-containing protein n=2 Tax=Cyanobacteriota TaxID=1117 RepID=A0A166I302_NODSP|nr:hypothetical protein [Nodularia spumigena]KZL47797.1 hypothetical protein A2T98_21400 [Nodularia spumigena CENA596]